MDERHLDMWRIVDRPEQVLQALDSAPEWSVEQARSFAVV